jgi:hypothetical protein
MQKYDVYRRGLWAGAVAIVLVAFNGCGGSDRPKTIPIDGHVTIDGKAPGETGKIFFTPTEAAEGYSRRPASGSYNIDGHYRVMSWAPDDGLVPGHYTVSVLPNEPDKTAIPKKYSMSATSGVELDVSADKGKIDFDIAVRTK